MLFVVSCLLFAVVVVVVVVVFVLVSFATRICPARPTTFEAFSAHVQSRKWLLSMQRLRRICTGQQQAQVFKRICTQHHPSSVLQALLEVYAAEGVDVALLFASSISHFKMDAEIPQGNSVSGVPP